MKENIVIFSSIPVSYFGIDESFRPLKGFDNYRIHWIMPFYSDRVRRSQLVDTEHFFPLQNFSNLGSFIENLGTGENNQISQILYISEYEFEIVADIGNQLGINAVSPERAKIFRNKAAMKEMARAGGISTPEYQILSSEGQIGEMLNKHNRVVIKPISGAGSVDTHFVDRVSQLESIKGVTYDGKFEVEQYIEGPMYHIDALVRNGEVLILEAGKYLTKVALHMHPGLHASVYSLDEERRTKILSYFSDVMNAFDISDGVVHLEVFEQENGELMFCEIALRPGGGGIAQCLEEKYGINVMEEHLLAQLGLPSKYVGSPAKSDSTWKNGTMGLLWRYNLKAGKISKISQVSELKSENIFYSRIDGKVGANVRPALFAGFTLAQFGINGNTEHEVLNEIQKVNDIFHFEIE